MGDTEYQRRRRAREKGSEEPITMGIPTRSSEEATEFDIEKLAEREAKAYTKFRAVPISGGWEYSGDGKGTIYTVGKFTNYEDLINEMTYDEKQAFRMWTQGWFMSGQQWGGYGSMSAEDKRLTRIFDKFLDRATLEKGVELHRAGTWHLVNDGDGDEVSMERLQAMKGKYIEVDGSMSTAMASEGLRGMGRDKPVEYVIKIPAGSTGAGMWVGDSRINGWGPRQREFMTNRDIMVQVGNCYYDYDKMHPVVELYYVSRRRRHKYE